MGGNLERNELSFHSIHPVTLSSKIMGALQPDQPDKDDWTDYAFYAFFVLLLVFAVIASKYLC